MRGTQDGYSAPEAVRDHAGRELSLGMHWDFDAKRWKTLEGVPFGELHSVSAAVVDWDADGDVDLVLGTADGKVFRWTNLGTRTRHAFAQRAEPFQVGGAPLALAAGHAMPTVADWDQDGRFDLVVGSDDGAVAWARNVGRAGTPEFAELAPLLAKADESQGRSGKNALVEVADLNGDGDVDLLVGEHDDVDVVDARTPEQLERHAALMKELEGYASDRKVLAGSDAAAKQALGAERVADYEARTKELRELGPPKRPAVNRVWFYPRTRGSRASPR